MKKIFVCLLTAVILCSAAAFSVSALEIRGGETVITDDWGVFKAGDVNGDGRVDIRDLVRLKKYFVGSENTLVKTAADIENDKILNTDDLAALRRLLLEI